MYSILIVDDEKVICEGIKHRISILDIPELDSIKIALDGKEALKIIHRAPPDIIITDIRMPEVGGLELMKAVSEEYPHIKFIVSSGYDTYNYIRNAFRLGAVDYLLKPVTIEDLKYHIESIIEDLNNEKSMKTVESQLNMKDSNMVLNHLLFEQYLHPKIIDEMLAKSKSLFPYNFFAVGIVSIEYDLDYGKHLGLVIRQFELIKKNIVSSVHLHILFNHSKYPVIVFNLSERKLYPYVVKFLQDFTNNCKNISQLNSIASVSSVMDGITNIKKLYAQAEKAMAYRILYEPNQVIEYLHIPVGNRKLNLSKRDFICLENAVNLRSVIQFSLLIDKWFSKEFLVDQTVENIKKLYHIILKKITALMNSQEYFIMHEDEKDFDHFFSLDEIKAYLKDYLYKVIQCMSQQEKRGKTVIDIAIRYLNENYMKKINMAEVSNMVSMNYSYFSKLFKTEIGMTFTEYLTMLRMEKAKKLLKDPVNKICEVSAKIGYEDAHNFSRAFKNYFGISPKKYRKSNTVV